jgi:hypothetical protein
MEYFSSELEKKLAEKMTASLIKRGRTFCAATFPNQSQSFDYRPLGWGHSVGGCVAPAFGQGIYLRSFYPTTPSNREQVRNAMIERHKKSRDLAVKAQMSRKQLWRKAHP